jgi:hypothetical protein
LVRSTLASSNTAKKPTEHNPHRDHGTHSAKLETHVKGDYYFTIPNVDTVFLLSATPLQLLVPLQVGVVLEGVVLSEDYCQGCG